MADEQRDCRPEVERLAQAVRAHRAAGSAVELTAELVPDLVRAGLLAAVPACPERGILNIEEDGQVWCTHHDPEPAGLPSQMPAPEYEEKLRAFARARQLCRATMADLEKVLAARAHGKAHPPLLSAPLLAQLAVTLTCPADNYRSDHHGRVWCAVHGQQHPGNGRTACYAQQRGVAHALATYRHASGAPLHLDPARPETMDALLSTGALARRPLCQESGAYGTDAAGQLSCSHHGPIQDQLVHDGARWSVLVNPRA